VIEAARALILALLADPMIATALRATLAAPIAEQLDAAAVEAYAHVRMRVVLDAARRGDLTILRAGRKPLVSRDELDRWLRTRVAKTMAPTLQLVPPSEEDTDEAAYQRSVRRARGGAR